MHILGGIALGWYLVGALPPLLAPAAQSAPSAGERGDLVTLVESVQDADYRGDLTRLRALAADMEPYTEHPALAPAARYWRGFAHWRHALNSLNDGALPDSVDADFAAAVVEFRKALLINPSDIEAQIGLAAGLGNRAYFNMKAPGRASEFLAELAPLVAKIRSTAPDNPRTIFVVAPTLFWTPPDRGGDRGQALAMLERGIRLAASRPPSDDSLYPDWADAELHMLLAWFCLNLEPPDGARALPHAEAALALQPTWRYVRDSLLPQARRHARHGSPAGPGGPRVRLTTLAYRVHRMQSMLAFYSQVFGVRFHQVDTGGGIRSQFGELGGITLKFVPIRDAVDFEGFPVHQPGFDVPDVRAAFAAARKHGGRAQDEPRLRDGKLQASVRDPDGNTLELYGPE